MKIRIRRPQSALSLTATLAIAFFVLSAVVLLISGGVQIFSNIQTQQETIFSKQQLIAQDATKTVSSFIQEKSSVLEAALWLANPAAASPAEQKQILDSLLGLQPAFRQLVLLDSQEQVLVQISRLSQAMSEKFIDRIEHDLFAQVKQGDRYIGSVYVDEDSSEPMVIMAVPATDAFGDFQGTLVTEVNLKFMWDLVDRLKVGETGQAYVVDRQGNLIAFSDTARVLKGENVSHLKEVGEFISNPAPVDETGTSISSGIEGTTIMGTYVPLGTPDWAVVTELPVREAYQAVIRGAVISVGVVLVMAMLAGLSGVYVARRLAVPLLDLTETATQIAEGDLNLEATVEGTIEVVRLADAFNSMTTQLRSFIAGLEQRVADRTRGLQTAAEVAGATTSVLDPGELVHQAVDLIRERFDLYYVGLFLLDEEQRFAVLRAGTGEAGQQMMTQGHKLEISGDSMVGQCVAGGEVCIMQDGDEEVVRFDNPLLPDTRTEVVLPLRSRGRTIGAMTVQSVEEAAFDEADIAVMQTMADQLTNAILNAQLFAQTQVALEDTARAR
jgi:putative methionine-R-sulfoxide reductase with GAF domain